MESLDKVNNKGNIIELRESLIRKGYYVMQAKHQSRALLCLPEGGPPG